MASTPSPGLPSSPACTGAGNEKSRRYDRQLRLWGDHGQGFLEASKVCLINATGTGTEILKSLVLPGIGAFTIVDGKKVTAEDVGCNFFLDSESLGQPRGVVAARRLLKMNKEVRGDCLDETPEQVLKSNPDFFKTFTLVIATGDISESALSTLSSMFWESNIPLMVVRTYGFISYIRLQIKEHTIVESHPDNVIEDLRLEDPFPALKTFLDSQKIDKHTPYVVVLHKYLELWRKENGGQRPKSYKEKKLFKEMLRRGGIDDDDDDEDKENFEEAVRAVNTIFHSTTIPDAVRSILYDAKSQNLSSNSSDFWIIARAVKDFYEKEKRLPLRGVIPDMFSDTERYVDLQRIYREKADQDAEAVHNNVQCNLEAIGRPAESISESSVRSFCKNASNLRLIRGGCSIAEESNLSTTLETTLEQNPDSDVMYYLILRGVDRYHSEYFSYPGVIEPENDVSKLKSAVSKVMNQYRISGNPKDEYIHEICRYGAAELPAMSAFIGGCAAQEAIKLITKQYVPIDSLFIYNAMTSETCTIKM